MFRDKFDACHVVMAATKTTWLASKKEEYLHRHIAYIVVHGKKKKNGKENKKNPKSVFVDKPFAFRGKAKQGLPSNNTY